MKRNGLRLFFVTCAAATLAGSEVRVLAAATSGGGAAGGGASGSAGAATPSTAPFSPAQAGAAANQNNRAAPAAAAGSVQQQPNQQQGVAVVTTNSFGVMTTNFFVTTNGFGTNQFGLGTNGFFTNGIAFTNQFAISNFMAFTNLFLTTNAVSFTNRFGLGPADTAITEFDRTLIITIRQRLFPMMRAEGGWAPVSFLGNQGAIVVFGEVISIQERNQVITRVQTTPGVVQVVNGLFINPQITRAPASSTTGSISRFLQPASDAALGDYYMHSATSNALGQREFNPPQRGTFIATNMNLPGVSNLAGVTNPNLTPTGPTNQLPIPLSELLTNTNAVTSPR